MTTEKKMSAEEKALEMFATMMIEKIESINGDWKKPWFTNGTQWARNLSGREYNGMNAFMLMMLCDEKKYELPVFATFDRITSLNFDPSKKGAEARLKDKSGAPLPYVKVNKGEKSFPVILPLFRVVHAETHEVIKYDDYRQMTEEERKAFRVYPSMQIYHVFNVCQTNIAEARPELYMKLKSGSQHPAPVADDFSFAPLDAMIDGAWECPIRSVYGDDAYYSISKDEIVVPEKRQFKSGVSYYGNLLHEMAHSTGAECRLHRIKPASFGSNECAKEELVAEMTAALVASSCGMEKYIKEDSAVYLKSWLKSLKKDTSFIKTVLTDVKLASHFIKTRLDAAYSSSNVA